MQNVTAVAHRGDPYRVRENTLPSLRSAIGRGADAVEIDVRLTRDGVPVLLHDATLERLWDHDRPLASLTWDEVREVTDGGVPALADALAATEGSRVMIDLPGAPGERAVRRIVDVVREQGAEDRVYYCAGAPAMLAVRAVDPDAEIALTHTSHAPPRRAPGGGPPALAQLPLQPGGPGARGPDPPRRVPAVRVDPGHPPLDAPPAGRGRGLDHHQPRRRPGRAARPPGVMTSGRAPR